MNMERFERQSDNLQKIAAELLNRHLRVDGYLVTITAAFLSPAGDRLKLYVSVLPDKFFGQALETLRKLAPSLRGELARVGKLRVAPKISWVIDDTEKEAAKLDDLFKQIEEEGE